MQEIPEIQEIKPTHKKIKRINILIFIILITIIISITATYAWFSIQRDVEITGMKLNVEVAESMQISLDGEKWTQSIQIANMRQFYGTYTGTGDSFTIYQAKKIDDGGNQNYVPTELLPVSTAGQVSNGKIQFVQGTMVTSSNGIPRLEGITTCSETDLEPTATIANRQGNNESHPYLVFDMYLRNLSAKTTGLDGLLLNEGSKVWIDTTGTSDQEGVGLKGTGLEYSARVGMIVYGNTISITATDEPGGKTVGESIRELEATGDEIAAIWEPNHKEHTQYVVSNNGRGITAVSQEVATYGIKVEAATANPNKIDNVNSTTDTKLVAVNTFKPIYLNVEEGTEAKSAITDTTGENVGLVPNQISKVRVYVWLEGQDPDCVDLASTGDKLNVTLKLTKEKTDLKDKNSYADENEPISESNQKNASQITASDYGGTVTNYKSTNNANITWRIFHSDGSNIYLIADNYVDRDYVPDGRQGSMISLNTGTYARAFGFKNIINDYDGSTDISESHLAKKWLGNFTYESAKPNMKVTAYLMDTNVWAGFKDGKHAKYAIGSPTLELFVESYNVTHESKKLETQVTDIGNGYGYDVKWSGEEFGEYYISGLDTSTTLYVISNVANATGLWLASPCAKNENYMMLVSSYGLIDHDDYTDKYFGIRTVVCLEENVILEKIDEDTYTIVE